MKWLELHHELNSLVCSLYDQGVPPWSEVTSMFAVAEEQIRHLEFQHEATVERAARAFALSKPLPSLTKEQRLMFWLRVSYAEDFVMGLCVGPSGVFPAPSLSRQRLYRWLLIDLWEHAGFSTMHGMIESLLSGWLPDMIRVGKN